MSIVAQRFKEEWNYFQKTNNFKSVEKMLELIKDKQYPREDISRFKSGKKTLNDEDLEIFSKLFNIRKDYLAGLSPYRTDEEVFLELQKRKKLQFAFHQVLVALGYADLQMEEDDYNITFPSNTREFIKVLQNSELDVENNTVICNVNNDTFVFLDNDSYKLFVSEIVDFIEFKMSKMFTYADTIPGVITEDEQPLLRPHNVVHFKDGTSTDFQIRYTPTSELTQDAVSDAFELTDN